MRSMVEGAGLDSVRVAAPSTTLRVEDYRRATRVPHPPMARLLPFSPQSYQPASLPRVGRVAKLGRRLSEAGWGEAQSASSVGDSPHPGLLIRFAHKQRRPPHAGEGNRETGARERVPTDGFALAPNHPPSPPSCDSTKLSRAEGLGLQVWTACVIGE
jgi:hypothetical protein